MFYNPLRFEDSYLSVPTAFVMPYRERTKGTVALEYQFAFNILVITVKVKYYFNVYYASNLDVSCFISIPNAQ